MAEFDSCLYSMKALDVDYDRVVIGYYKANYKHFMFDIFADIPHDVEINPYTLCRNTGIKKNGKYLYENDLVEYSTAFDKGLAIIEFDEMRCRYMLRFNLDYSSRGDIDRYNIKVVGNVTLSDEDMKRFAEYSKNQSFIKNVEPECRSKAHINKEIKKFLPRYEWILMFVSCKKYKKLKEDKEKQSSELCDFLKNMTDNYVKAMEEADKYKKLYADEFQKRIELMKLIDK